VPSHLIITCAYTFIVTIILIVNNDALIIRKKELGCRASFLLEHRKIIYINRLSTSNKKLALYLNYFFTNN
jgi:hypothetical protein